MVSFKVDLTLLPANSKLVTNTNSGLYIKGKSFDLEKKAAVATIYERHRGEAKAKGQDRPFVSKVAREAEVSRDFVVKIEAELKFHGRVVALSPPNSSELRKKGVGACALLQEDENVLLQLMERNFFRTRQSYVNFLFEIRGTVVSEMTISKFFLQGFPIKRSLQKPDLVPKEKFKPENVQRYFEYIDFIRSIDP